ncbi:HNH endonuclease [Streptomyces sp. LP11]|uniref:HNH endonuclease n=1 Tax=Streptomyces pyxinicus TaxID=2970331 RepID=A0ABT2AUK2_9ACTN|nr:HNH endonuclease [Streptomyces sp. LP11]MCS0599933.1 HNH endonuclease [Streptomyces sp. LP11]
MGLEDVTRAGVIAAVDECRHLGNETFHRRYGFDRATTYELILDGYPYDAPAIAGVAHLYSVGDLLPADGPGGDARSAADHLRALGFTVKDSGTVTDQPPQVAPQVLLQPRGGLPLRGPQNFAKSVRQGVPIAAIQGALGEQAEVLTALYPDGIARLWGSTPTTQVNNEKVRALRNRRVGDDVLFYTENHFIARARILHLFDSPAVAGEVWGTDAENVTWEHIIALGDVEEFPVRVPAAPILRRLDAQVPLRSLTLRSAEDYRGVAELLPKRLQPVPPRTPAPARVPSLRPTTRDLLNRIGSLDTPRATTNEALGRCQSLALLWAISRVATGKPRLAPWSSFRAEVGPLLTAFGPSGSGVTAEGVFRHLQSSDLWEVHGLPDHAGAVPQTALLDTVQPVAGLTFASAELLQDPFTRLEAVLKLCSTQLDEIGQRELLARVGLSGYETADGLTDEDDNGRDREPTDTERATGPAKRREYRGSRPVRNAGIVAEVKEMYGHACQVCGTRLRYLGERYNQAAHIRGLGSPHNGPDELPNLLCLCPNHHILFDGLEIYVDTDGAVRWTHGGGSLGQLRQNARHKIDEAYLRYHRALCALHARTAK